MLQQLASILKECERVGLQDEVRVLKSWLSTQLPHLADETRLIKQALEIFKKVAGHSPNSVPQVVFTIPEINYTTEGKTTRDIIGELGYLLNSVYKRGYTKHSFADFPDEIIEDHTKYGLYLKELISLIGTYFTLTKHGENLFSVDQEFEEQAGSISTRIISLMRRLEEALVKVRPTTQALIHGQSPTRSRFNETDEVLAKQQALFFDQIDHLIRQIRGFFTYRHSIHPDNLNDAVELLKEFSPILDTLNNIGSSLDLEGGQFNFSSLMYWATVFEGEEKRATKTGISRRRELLNELTKSPELKQYTNLLETTVHTLQAEADDLKSKGRTFQQALRAYKELQEKLSSYLNEINTVFERNRIEEAVKTIKKLPMILDNIKKENPKLRDSQILELAQKKIGLQGIGIVQNVFNKDLELKLSSTEDREVQAFIDDVLIDLQRKKETLQEHFDSIKKITAVNVFEHEDFNKVSTALLIVADKLNELAESPLTYLHAYEQFWVPLLSFGKVYDQEGNISKGFSNLVEEKVLNREDILASYDTEYSGASFAQGETKEERIAYIASHVDKFNIFLEGLLQGKEAPLKDEELEELKSFIEKGTTETREWALSVKRLHTDTAEESPEEAEAFLTDTFGLEATRLETIIDSLMNLPDDLDDWLGYAKASNMKFKKFANIKMHGNQQLAYFTLTPNKAQDDFHLIEIRLIKQSEELYVLKVLEYTSLNDFKELKSIDIDKNLFRQPLSLEDNVLLVILHLIREVESRVKESGDEIRKSFTQFWKNLFKDKEEEVETEDEDEDEIPEDLFSEVEDEEVVSEATEDDEDEEEEDEEEEESLEETDTADLLKKVEETSPPRSRLDRYKLNTLREFVNPKGKEEGKEKETDQRARRLETIRQKMGQFETEIPRGTVTQFVRTLNERLAELRHFHKIILDASNEAYRVLKERSTQVNELLRGDVSILPTFPRVVYSVYEPTKYAKEHWDSWKKSKVQLPLYEMKTLLITLEEYRANIQIIKQEQKGSAQNIPYMTIDSIARKFEDFKRLVG